MQTEDNASLAGESANEPVSMDLDAAADMIGDLEKQASEPGTATQDGQTTEGSAEPETTAATSPEEGDETEPGQESEPADTSEDEEVIHGNKWLVLRDGSRVRAGELKKLWDQKPELERQRAELTQRQQQIDAAAQEFQSKQAQIAQQAQFLQQYGPVVLEQLRGAIPPEVTDEQWNADPIEAQLLERARNKAINKFHQVQQGLVQQHQQQQQAHQKLAQEQHERVEAERKAWQKSEVEAMYEKHPELRDPPKAQAYYEKLVNVAKVYNVDPKDIGNVNHNIWEMLSDLADFQALKSQKAVAEKKVAAAPPVRAPGKRTPPAEQQAQARMEAENRLRATGSLEDAAALIP